MEESEAWMRPVEPLSAAHPDFDVLRFCCADIDTEPFATDIQRHPSTSVGSVVLHKFWFKHFCLKSPQSVVLRCSSAPQQYNKLYVRIHWAIVVNKKYEWHLLHATVATTPFSVSGYRLCGRPVLNTVITSVPMPFPNGTTPPVRRFHIVAFSNLQCRVWRLTAIHVQLVGNDVTSPRVSDIF
ncbi:hypothetical protein OAM67_00670 [bacterium]|nr:hypothetical protein [bacterium]